MIDIHRPTSAEVQTTNATATDLLGFAIPSDSVTRIYAQVIARRTNAAAGWIGTRMVTVRADSAGAVTIISAQTIGADDSAGTITPTFSTRTEANRLFVRVAGGAGQTILWQCASLAVSGAP